MRPSEMLPTTPHDPTATVAPLGPPGYERFWAARERYLDRFRPESEAGGPHTGRCPEADAPD